MRDAYKCRGGGYSEDPRGCQGGVEAVLPGPLRLRLSKLVSGILRHFPDRYGVRLDTGGWASLGDLVAALRRLPSYSWVEPWHLEALAALDPKGRFEVREGRIRARYGHSVRVEVEPLPGEPPRLLYHGTTRDRLHPILSRGLLPMKRLKVHLTTTPEAAEEVARRHGPDVVILEVDVECMERRGLKPEKASHAVYVADWVPPECLRPLNAPRRAPGEG